MRKLAIVSQRWWIYDTIHVKGIPLAKLKHRLWLKVTHDIYVFINICHTCCMLEDEARGDDNRGTYYDVGLNECLWDWTNYLMCYSLEVYHSIIVENSEHAFVVFLLYVCNVSSEKPCLSTFIIGDRFTLQCRRLIQIWDLWYSKAFTKSVKPMPISQAFGHNLCRKLSWNNKSHSSIVSEDRWAVNWHCGSELQPS